MAHKHPEKILTTVVDPIVGLLPFQARDLGFKLGLNAAQIKEFTQILLGLGKLFIDNDLSLLEVNLLVLKENGELCV